MKSITVTSSKRGKPDTQSFDHVVEEAMITPEKTLFIDDNEDNIRSAASTGLSDAIVAT